MEDVMIEIDVWAWYTAGRMATDWILLDMSGPREQHQVLNKHTCIDDYRYRSEYDGDDGTRALGFSRDTKEVLIKWRGQVPLEFCNVIDAATGDTLFNLGYIVHQIRTRSPRSLLTKTTVKTLGPPPIAAPAGSQPSLAPAPAQPGAPAASAAAASPARRESQTPQIEAKEEQPKNTKWVKTDTLPTEKKPSRGCPVDGLCGWRTAVPRLAANCCLRL